MRHSDIPPSDNPVLRAKAGTECQLPVGQMNVKIKGSPNAFDTISFYCTKPKNHHDQCLFEGKDLIVMRRRL